jgi:hypothetical protein
MWLLHSLALEILDNLSILLSKSCYKAIDDGEKNTVDWTSFSQS